MGKKKLKKRMRKAREMMLNSSRSAVASDEGSSLEHMLHNNGDIVFMIYKVSNGYNVLSRFYKRDRSNHVQETRQDITFIHSLEELAALMATNQAAYKVMGN